MMKNFALYTAITLYGLLSSPTPDIVSWVEIAIIVLLIFSIGLFRPIIALTEKDLPFYLQGHKIFFVMMIVIPTVIGIINGYALANIARDLFPVMALILPLVFYGERLNALSIVMAIVGGAFALRYIAPIIPPLDFMAADTSLLYLANSPLVPFAAIMGFHWLSEIRDNSITQRILGGLLCVICFAAMAMMLQRAPLILSALGCLGILGLRTIQKPIQSMVLGMVIVVCLLPILPVINEIFQSLESKTLNVGLNNRVEEFQAVMAQSTWLGHGWGAEFQSPAVGDVWVRFTHNMVSYYWFKAGILGAILSVAFIGVWAWQNIKLIRLNPAIGVAIAIPFLVHVTLYTGFKTLDFALLLTLLTAQARRPDAETA